MEWTKQFYKQQFSFLHDSFLHGYANYYNEEVARIDEQVGKPYTSVLELGAGAGFLANALALANKEVTAIELVHELVAYAQTTHEGRFTMHCADFYTVQLAQRFDVIIYMDGFGVGDDADQLTLLTRIRDWLAVDGCALIDIYEPNYWRAAPQSIMHPTGEPHIVRQYGFDEQGQRMLDHWWDERQPTEKVTQSLACYSLAQIHSLCEQAGLQLTAVFAGGAVDYTSGTYREVAPLDSCISYRIKVKRA